MKLTPIDTEKIRGRYHYSYVDPKNKLVQSAGAGDDTEASLKLLATKLNEVIQYINSSHGEVEVLPINEE